MQGGVNTTDIAIQTWAGRLLMFLTIPAVIISLILIIIAIIKIIKIRK
ncbi:MAG: hypothetical protein LBF15_01295 [Candidatus Peribacteria bacterium]|nr:hypothetical protein [Candidatus Peribacteria bacterium]